VHPEQLNTAADMSARDVSKLRTRLRALGRRAQQPGPKLEDLPPDMLREISDRLPPGDARRFSGVSSAVRTAVRDRAGAPLPYDPDYTPTDYARNKATNNFEWAWDWGFDEAEDDGRLTVRYEAPDGRVYEAETHAPPPSGVNYGAPWASLQEIRPPGGGNPTLYLRDYRDDRDPYYRVFWGSIVVEAPDEGPIDRRALALLLELIASRWGLHKRDVARSFRLFLHDGRGRDLHDDKKEEVVRSNFEDLLSVLRELQDTNPDFGKQTAPRRPRQ